MHGPSACCEGDSLDGHLFSRHGQLAGVARLPVARSTEDSWDAILRKTAILELVGDEDVQSFVVHGGGLSSVAASPKSQIHPGPRMAEVQAGYARKQNVNQVRADWSDRKKGVLATVLDSARWRSPSPRRSANPQHQPRAASSRCSFGLATASPTRPASGRSSLGPTRRPAERTRVFASRGSAIRPPPSYERGRARARQHEPSDRLTC